MVSKLEAKLPKKDGTSPATVEQSNNEQTRKKFKSKKKKTIFNCLDNPDKILEAVLSQKTFEKLSKKAEARLKQGDAVEHLKKLDYDSERIDMIPVEMITALPHGFQHMRVNLSPYAITRINCINEVPAKRYTRRNNKNKNKNDPKLKVRETGEKIKVDKNK